VTKNLASTKFFAPGAEIFTQLSHTYPSVIKQLKSKNLFKIANFELNHDLNLHEMLVCDLEFSLL